jgi:hypothetical protein
MSMHRRRARRRPVSQNKQNSRPAGVQRAPGSLDIITSDSLKNGAVADLTPPSNRALAGGLRGGAIGSDQIMEELWQSHSEDFTFDLDSDDFDSADVLIDIGVRAEKNTTAVIFKPVVAPITEAPELNGVTVLPRPVVPHIVIEPQTEVYEGPLDRDEDTLGAVDFEVEAIEEDEPLASAERDPITTSTVKLGSDELTASGRRLLVTLMFLLGIGVGYAAASWPLLNDFYQQQWQAWQASRTVVTPAATTAEIIDENAPSIND